MRYCLNPWCSQRQNTNDIDVCQQCGTPLLIHDRFWLVRPLRPLDEDGYFDVFEAIDVTGSYIAQPGSIKVLKVLRPGYGYEQLIPALQHEARALRLLKHPGIPKSDIDDDFAWSITHEDREVELYCLAIQKFEGETLDDWLETHGPITQEQALEWLEEMADILHCVHQAEIIHRDIKPSNIIVQPNNKLALIDFGGADIKGYSMEAQADKYTAPLIGTVGYTPQEQINGNTLPESDFYTLGLTMISAVCGKPLNCISYDPKTFERLWRPEAPQIDRPLADFLDRLRSERVWDRPRNYELVDLVEQLPDQIKRYQKFRSPWFKVGVGLLILVFLFGVYKGATFIISQYCFREGTIKLYEGKLKEAKSDLRIAIQFDPGHASAYHNLASACLKAREIDCAIANYNKALKLDPKRWSSYYQLGNYYEDEKQYDQAATYYKKAIYAGGDQAGKAISNLARIRILQEDYQDAIRLATKGIPLSADSPYLRISLYKNRGWAKLELKQYDSALKDLMKASEITSTQEYQRADPFCLLAQVYEVKKKTVQANVHWEICLRMPSDAPEVAEWRYEVIDRLFDFE